MQADQPAGAALDDLKGFFRGAVQTVRRAKQNANLVIRAGGADIVRR
jgi:hypothetical protein